MISRCKDTRITNRGCFENKRYCIDCFIHGAHHCLGLGASDTNAVGASARYVANLWCDAGGLNLGPKAGRARVVALCDDCFVGPAGIARWTGRLGCVGRPDGWVLLGMIPGAVVTGWLALVLNRDSKLKTDSSSHEALQSNSKWQIVRYALAAMLGGIVLVYAIGIPWLALVTKMGLTKASWAMVVFLPGDVLKALVAAVVAQRICRLKMV